MTDTTEQAVHWCKKCEVSITNESTDPLDCEICEDAMVRIGWIGTIDDE